MRREYREHQYKSRGLCDDSLQPVGLMATTGNRRKNREPYPDRGFKTRGEKHGVALLLFVLPLLHLACSSVAPLDCFTNDDCAGAHACVEGRCVSDPDECEVLGLFEAVAETAPKHATKVTHMQVALDDDGRAHYCYYGYDGETPVSYYGKQVEEESFEEEPLVIEGEPVLCGGIALSEEGTPFILSKSPGAVMFRIAGWDDKKKKEVDVSWEHLELTGLTGPGARAALYGDDTVISLTKDGENGMYAALSLGFQVAMQPLYVAHIDKKEGIEVLVNGWKEKEDPTVVGYAPQVMMAEKEPYMVVGRLFQSAVWLSGLDLEITADVEGTHPRAAPGKKNSAWMVYLGYNRNLVLSQVKEGKIEEAGALAAVSVDLSAGGRIPWDLTVDREDVAHVLYEDKAQGSGALVYKAGDKDNLTGPEQIVTTALSRELSGNGLFDITCDLCGRPTVALIEDSRGEATKEPPLPGTGKEYRPRLRVLRWI